MGGSLMVNDDLARRNQRSLRFVIVGDKGGNVVIAGRQPRCIDGPDGGAVAGDFAIGAAVGVGEFTMRKKAGRGYLDGNSRAGIGHERVCRTDGGNRLFGQRNASKGKGYE